MEDVAEPDEESWKEEAQAVMADIQEHVESVSVSTLLPSSCKKIYINLTTFEKKKYCVELTGHGFRIVGNEYDCTDHDQEETFETPYSLLDSVSPEYRNSFGRALENKLNRLKEEEEKEEKEREEKEKEEKEKVKEEEDKVEEVEEEEKVEEVKEEEKVEEKEEVDEGS